MNNLDIILCGVYLTVFLQNIYFYFRYMNLKRKYARIIKPLYVKSKLIRETKKGKKMALIYEVNCSSAVSSDVVSRVLTVSVNGSDISVSTFDSLATNLGELSFSQGDNVVLSLVDVDDAGNRSDAATLEFVAQDSIPPESPTGLGVKLVREE